ncbi:DNA ligase 4 [Palaemon carinicauda]|uniref:DNA ligase 4 n=1 Tax=Palaemon carinicauda TaxID=392227 RepID=UPI0035B685E9
MWSRYVYVSAICLLALCLNTTASSDRQMSMATATDVLSSNATYSLTGNILQYRKRDVLFFIGSLLNEIFSGSQLLVLQDDYYAEIDLLFGGVQAPLRWHAVEVTLCQRGDLELWVQSSFRVWPSDIIALLVCSAENARDLLRWVSEQKTEPTSLLRSLYWVIITDDEELILEYEGELTEESQATIAYVESEERFSLLTTAFRVFGSIGFEPVGKWWRFQEGWSHQLNRPLSSLTRREQYRNLHGRPMKVAALDNWPWFGLKESPAGEALPDTGIDVSIITTLSQTLNFTIEIVIPEDGQWGGPQPDGTVSGLIGMVSAYKAHLAIDEITITASRETVVDFTFPYYVESSTCVSRAPKEKSRAFAVFSPYTSEVWLTVGISVIAISFAIYITSLLSLSTLDGSNSREDLTLDRITFSTFRSLVKQDNIMVLPFWSIKYLFGAWYLYCYYVNAMYSGTLTAFLSVPSYEKPIDSLSDILEATEKGFYPVIFREGSIDFLLKFATSGVYREIGQLISEEKNYVDVIADGVAAALQSKAVYIEARLASEMQTLKQGQDQFYMGRQSFFPQSYGIVCRTRSPFKGVFSNVMSKSVSVASLVPWSQVCKMLDKVQSAVKGNKKEMLLKFITQYRDLLRKKTEREPQAPDSFFPMLRVLLPALDRARGAYGVKERKLAELYIRILGLKKDGTDGQKLLNFRKPKSLAGGETGDFADVAYYVLRSRCPDKGQMTLEDVECHLTAIAENYAAKNHEEVERSLLVMLRSMTALEQKWLIRVLLKDMRLGIGQGTIFNAWHPDAKDLYDVNNSLEKVSVTLRDPSVRLHEIEVSLFSAFRPMLAERALLEKVEIQMNHKTYYAETKYDGERSQIHKKGSVYKYFSRNGFDFTDNFGADPQSGIFTPYLHRLFHSSVKDVILDGEVVSWSKTHKSIISKGEHMDVKNLREDGDYQVCLCAFDIIYLNGEVLTNLPLSERLKKLKNVITPHEGRVIISPNTEVHSKEDVVKILNEAIDNREEGVVLKDPDSVYRPASRKAGWIKVKPEYVDSLVPELDLLIIGAYYGKGRRQGVLSHFLLAVSVESKEPGGKPREFHSICRVGSGYTVAELSDLVAKLTPHTCKQQPPGVIVSREKPDVWINPLKSCVVQVRAAEVVKSLFYQTGVTLRFPRVEKVRYDKPWYDVLTTKELNELEKEASGKLATKHYIDSSDEPAAKRKTPSKGDHPSLPSHFRPADLTKVVKKADVLAGKEICVMGGDENMTKHQVEKLIVEHGGSLTQHPKKDTFCVVADTFSVRVNNYVKSHNIVRPSWIELCIKRSSLMPFGPLDVLSLVDGKRDTIKELFDEYGDSYTDPVDERTLKRIMENMKEKSWKKLSPQEMHQLDQELCDPGDINGLFRLTAAYFYDGDSNDLPTLAFRLHGGTPERNLSKASHVIITRRCGSEPRPSELVGQHLVTSDWIYDCIEKGKLLEERHYAPILLA